MDIRNLTLHLSLLSWLLFAMDVGTPLNFVLTGQCLTPPTAY